MAKGSGCCSLDLAIHVELVRIIIAKRFQSRSLTSRKKAECHIRREAYIFVLVLASGLDQCAGSNLIALGRFGYPLPMQFS